MNTGHYHELLIAEKTKLETELGTIGKRNPTNPENWDTMPADTAPLASHEEAADRLEDNEDREAAQNTLEERLREVTTALDKIANGNYGICEISGEEIEADRLEANPAARTCKAHLDA